MTEGELNDTKLFEEFPPPVLVAAGASSNIDEALFFQTRVEVAMSVFDLSPEEAVDYICTREKRVENGWTGGSHLSRSKRRPANSSISSKE